MSGKRVNQALRAVRVVVTLGILGESEMPINAILQSIDGTSRIGSVVDAYGGLNRCLPFGSPDAEQNTQTFPLFQHVGAYCDVVFKQAQMPQLLEELDLLMSGTSNPESRSLLEQVRELAVRCRDSKHLCLRFFGD
jgi:hypothetical protein